MIPEEVSQSIDTLAAILRATFALERARSVGVMSLDLCMGSLREQARAQHVVLDAWARNVLKEKWGVRIGDQVSVTFPNGSAEGQVRQAVIRLRIIDTSAFPRILLTLVKGEQTVDVTIDGVGPCMDEVVFKPISSGSYEVGPGLRLAA